MLAGEATYYMVKINDKWAVFISEDGIGSTECAYSYAYSRLFYPKRQISPKMFKFTAIQETNQAGFIPGFKYELLFSGRNNNYLNFAYREYTPDNVARPAFFQNVTYQEDAKQIRFKDLRLNLSIVKI